MIFIKMRISMHEGLHSEARTEKPEKQTYRNQHFFKGDKKF